MSDGNERFSIEERDTFGKIADNLAEYVANFYGRDPSTITEEEMGFLEIARCYLKLYQATFIEISPE